ncbi:MAG: hypothetical protein JWR69_4220 [Pedosphaera sp.]|nr:hypothetical protein [Pedosphaera sp.]
MKTIPRLICVVGIGCVIVAALAADRKHSARANPKAEVGALTEQIRSLQTRVQALEQRLQKFERAEIMPAMGALIQSPNGIISVPNAVADPGHPPKIWGEGECNGWKYQLIPLRGSDSDTWAKADPIAR